MNKTFMDSLADKPGQSGQISGQTADKSIPIAVDADTRRDAVKRQLLLLHQTKPTASFENLGQSLNPPLARQRVSELVAELKAEGYKW